MSDPIPDLLPPPLPPAPPWWRRCFFDNLWGAAFASALVTALLGAGAAGLSIKVLGNYGFALFMGVPLACGFTAMSLYGIPARRPVGQGILVMTLALLMVGVAILCFAWDGLGCLIMAFPLAWTLGAAGVAIAFGIDHQRRESRRRRAAVNLFALAGVPLCMFGESRLPLPVPATAVTTTLDIAADPATVWRYVPACPDLPPPTETVFRLGIAYPLGTRMYGAGVGANRACLLSTGVMRERVTAWEPARRLRFEVLCTPCAMREISIYRDLQPPHVHNFEVMRAGEIQLVPLPGGGTRLVGTSWYEQRMWPAAYWMLYSDFVVHSVHRRVFNHIKQLAESDAASPLAPISIN